MAQRIQKRRGTAAAWTTANPVLAAAEFGYETDTKRLKIGDGITAWASLPYFGDATGVYVGQTAGQVVPNGGAVIDMGITHRADAADFTVDLTANTITVVNDGWYLVDARIYLSAFDNREWYTTITGSGVEGSAIAAGVNKRSSQVSGGAFIAAGTAVSLRLTNWSGVNLTTYTDATGVSTYLRIVRL